MSFFSFLWATQQYCFLFQNLRELHRNPLINCLDISPRGKLDIAKIHRPFFLLIPWKGEIVFLNFLLFKPSLCCCFYSSPICLYDVTSLCTCYISHHFDMYTTSISNVALRLLLTIPSTISNSSCLNWITNNKDYYIIRSNHSFQPICVSSGFLFIFCHKHHKTNTLLASSRWIHICVCMYVCMQGWMDGCNGRERCIAK